MSITRRLMSWALRLPTRPVVVSLITILAASGSAAALTLGEALDAAMTANPELAALEHEARALDALVEQARLLPNPELQTEVENVGGSGAYGGDDATESTVRLSQRLELGGKRAARTRVATLAADVIVANLELRRRDLRAAVTTAFATALAAQQRVALARDGEQLANDSLRTISSSVAAGAMSTVEIDRSRLAIARARSERLLRERQALAARSALAATWGAMDASVGDLVGDLAVPVALPSREALLSKTLECHPALLRADSVLAERTADVELERANRVPDVTVGAGGRHFNDDDDFAMVFELSAPLPLFDRNQGQIAEALARLSQAREERRSTELSVRASLSAAYDRFVIAEEQRSLLDESVLPAATRALDATIVGNRKGLFPQTEVLIARRTLQELRADRLDRLEERFVAAAELEQICGIPLLESSHGEPR